jgi:hypothetical protein
MMAPKVVYYLARPPSSACEIPQAAGNNPYSDEVYQKKAVVPAEGMRVLMMARHNITIRHQSTSMRVGHQ